MLAQVFLKLFFEIELLGGITSETPKNLRFPSKGFLLGYTVIYFDTVNKIAANLSGIDIKGVWLLGNEYSLLIWPLFFTIVF
ncbi:hypothetical protein JN11_01156 [Mucilaginibacter frigoritolerans]|uniref:Uncharacterized protein n=1 Tax=Mucilaginibacter frigoritolerans TaxID=652788 RepID=A0A562UD52_9SPHI|nr:hypothetical protein JN11_01156 [Mucilaginibacter frigoritolerans]